MSTKKICEGQQMECPHCKSKLDGSLKKFVFNSHFDSRKENVCKFCKKAFFVEYCGNDEYWVDSEDFDE